MKGKRPYSKGSCIRRNGRKADKIASKTRGVDVFVFMKDKFAGTEAEDDIDKISRKNKGRDIGGGTDMRTGLREKQYYFRSNGDATRFIKMVKKLGVMKGYRASYTSDDSRKSLRLNPAPRLQNNGVRKKTWKIGEYAVGGIIEAMVNSEGNIVGIRNAEYKTGDTISKQLFRWPLDKSRLEMHLNDLTTSYYADKIIQWLMAGSWELRSNPEKSLSDKQIERSYKILMRYSRLRKLLNMYDVLELFPKGILVQSIRKDLVTMALLLKINQYMQADYYNRKLMADQIQGALDTYVDDLEVDLEKDAEKDARAYREVERGVDRQRG